MAGDLEDIAAAAQISASIRGVRVVPQKLLDLNVEVIEVGFRSLQPPFEIIHETG